MGRINLYLQSNKKCAILGSMRSTSTQEDLDCALIERLALDSFGAGAPYMLATILGQLCNKFDVAPEIAAEVVHVSAQCRDVPRKIWVA